jgi:hypothetical protein
MCFSEILIYESYLRNVELRIPLISHPTEVVLWFLSKVVFLGDPTLVMTITGKPEAISRNSFLHSTAN